MDKWFQSTKVGLSESWGPAQGLSSLIFLGGKLSPPLALALATKVAHPVDELQLVLDGGGDVHVIWDVYITDISAGHEKVIQLDLMPPAVRVGDLAQADVHESINIVYASTSYTLIPKVHSGDLAMQSLQKDDQTVLGDGPLFH